jgi:leader peptidase (prepilin peptidase)/N-methyltransferase
MVVITFIDLDHQLILDRVSLPSAVIFYGLGLLLPERRWSDGLIGAAIGYGVIWGISEAYYRITGREGLGLGDAALMAVVGALLGWQGVYMSITLGSFAGVLVVVPALLVRRATGRTDSGAPADDAPEPPAGDAAGDDPGGEAPSIRHVAVPFGPFLAMGAVFYLLGTSWLSVKFTVLGG